MSRATARLARLVAVLAALSVGHAGAVATFSSAYKACIMTCPNGRRVIPPGGCRDVDDNCLAALAGQWETACGVPASEITSTWASRIQLDELVFDSGARSQAECENYQNQVLVPSQKDPTYQTTTEVQEAQCGCVNFTMILFNLDEAVLGNVPPLNDESFCDWLVPTVAQQLVGKSVCANTVKKVKNVALVGKFANKLCDAFLDVVSEVADAVLGPLVKPFCNMAVKIVKREFGLDIDGIIQAAASEKERFARKVCGSTTCTGPQTDLCEAVPSSSNPLRSVLVAVSKAYWFVKNLIEGAMCFPEDAQVTTPEGRLAMKDLRMGAQVLVARPDGSLVYEEVFMFGHKDPHTQAEFVMITTASGARIVASPGHYMLAVTAEVVASLSRTTPLSFEHHTRILPARQVRVGDRLWVVEVEPPAAAAGTVLRGRNSTGGGGGGAGGMMNLRPEQIAGIEFGAARGLYNPHTLSGTLIVDGVAATQFTDHLLPPSLTVYKLASLPLYALSRLPMSLGAATSLNEAALRLLAGQQT